jgi:hypothetical protein
VSFVRFSCAASLQLQITSVATDAQAECQHTLYVCRRLNRPYPQGTTPDNLAKPCRTHSQLVCVANLQDRPSSSSSEESLHASARVRNKGCDRVSNTEPWSPVTAYLPTPVTGQHQEASGDVCAPAQIEGCLSLSAGLLYQFLRLLSGKPPENGPP